MGSPSVLYSDGWQQIILGTKPQSPGHEGLEDHRRSCLCQADNFLFCSLVFKSGLDVHHRSQFLVGAMIRWGLGGEVVEWGQMRTAVSKRTALVIGLSIPIPRSLVGHCYCSLLIGKVKVKHVRHGRLTVPGGLGKRGVSLWTAGPDLSIRGKQGVWMHPITSKPTLIEHCEALKPQAG